MIDYIDVVEKENDSISVTGRLVVNSGHVTLNQKPDTYHVCCRAHGVKIEISALQSETIEDSTAFCQHCLNGEPPIKQEIAPLARVLASQLQCVRTSATISRFVNDLDI